MSEGTKIPFVKKAAETVAAVGIATGVVGGADLVSAETPTNTESNTNTIALESHPEHDERVVPIDSRQTVTADAQPVPTNIGEPYTPPAQETATPTPTATPDTEGPTVTPTPDIGDAWTQTPTPAPTGSPTNPTPPLSTTPKPEPTPTPTREPVASSVRSTPHSIPTEINPPSQTPAALPQTGGEPQNQESEVSKLGVAGALATAGAGLLASLKGLGKSQKKS
jgi:hypothetical protein